MMRKKPTQLLAGPHPIQLHSRHMGKRQTCCVMVLLHLFVKNKEDLQTQSAMWTKLNQTRHE